MRINPQSPLHRSCLGLSVGAAAVLFGLGLGWLGVGEPAATFLMVTFSIIFVLALIGILA